MQSISMHHRHCAVGTNANVMLLLCMLFWHSYYRLFLLFSTFYKCLIYFLFVTLPAVSASLLFLTISAWYFLFPNFNHSACYFCFIKCFPILLFCYFLYFAIFNIPFYFVNVLLSISHEYLLFFCKFQPP